MRSLDVLVRELVLQLRLHVVLDLALYRLDHLRRARRAADVDGANLQDST